MSFLPYKRNKGKIVNNNNDGFQIKKDSNFLNILLLIIELMTIK